MELKASALSLRTAASSTLLGIHSMELKVFSTDTLPDALSLGIHSMELKAPCTGSWPVASRATNPFNGIERRGLPAHRRSGKRLWNPFNGIESLLLPLFKALTLLSAMNPFNGIERLLPRPLPLLDTLLRIHSMELKGPMSMCCQHTFSLGIHSMELKDLDEGPPR